MMLYAWLNDVLYTGALKKIFSNITVNHIRSTIYDNGAWFKLTLHISAFPYHIKAHTTVPSSHPNNACISNPHTFHQNAYRWRYNSTQRIGTATQEDWCDLLNKHHTFTYDKNKYLHLCVYHIRWKCCHTTMVRWSWLGGYVK